MKNFKFSHLLLAVVGVLAFASCQHEHADWTPGPQDSTMGVYFPSIDTYEIKDEATSISIPVMRVNAGEAAEVSFRWTVDPASAMDFFTPEKSVVSFEAGSEESVIEFAVDGTQFEMGKKYNLTIQLDQANATSYAISEATFVVIIPEPWVPYGATADDSMGIYFDDFFAGLLEKPEEAQGLGTYVKFEKHALNEKRIRAVNVFSPVTLGSIWGEVPAWVAFTVSSQDLTYLEFDITDPANVTLVGEVINDPYGDPLTIVPANFSMVIEGATYEIVLAAYHDYPFVLEDGIIKFPEQYVYAGAMSGGKYMGYVAEANTSGQLMLYLPGTEFANYGMNATYDGMYVSANGATAKAIFNFSLGADVASYKFAFAQGDVAEDPSAIVTAIVEGAEGVTVYESDADTKKWEVELTKGVYTLVAVPYTAEGEPRTQDAYALNFYFNGTGEMPEVNIEAELGTPVSFASAEEADKIAQEKPACFWVACKVVADPAQLKSIKFWYGNNQALVENNVDDDTLFATYAGDATAKWMEKLQETGSVVGYFNVLAGTPNFVVKLRFETIYGTTIDWSESYKLPAYDGDFPVGTYKMTEGKAELIFTIAPQKSYTSFFWTNDEFDGSTWYCEYDPETSIFKNTGVLYGYEDEGCQFGNIFGYANAERTQVYSYYSSESEKFEIMSDIKMELTENGFDLLTYLATPIFDYIDNTPVATGTSFFSFTPEATIVPYVETEDEEDEEVEEETPEAQSLSLKSETTTCVAVEAKRAERVEVVKPYNGAFNFRPANHTIK